MTELPKTTNKSSGTQNFKKKEETHLGNTGPNPDDFTTSEIMVGLIYTLTTDTMFLVLDYTILGAMITPVLRNGVAFTIWLWLKSKNDPHATKVGRLVFKGVANVIPWIPLFVNTFMFIVETYIHNHPERFAIMEKVAGATGGKV